MSGANFQRICNLYGQVIDLYPEQVVFFSKLSVVSLERLNPDFCPIGPRHKSRHQFPQRLQRQRISMLDHGEAALRHKGSES
jgi:hypothetical protein